MSKLEKTIQYFSYIFLFLLPWQTMLILEERFVNGAKWEYGTLGLYATEMVGWLCVLLFMTWYMTKVRGSGFRGKDFRWSKGRVFVLSLLLFTGYGLLIALVATDQLVAFQHARRVLLGSLLFLLFSIGPVNRRKVLWAFVIGSIPVSLLGIWQFLSQSTVASTLFGLSTHFVHEPGTSIIASESIGRWLRAYGSFSHPNVFGGYLVFAMLSSLFLYRSSETWGRITLQVLIVLQSATLFFSFSRSAWLAVGIVTLFYCFTVVFVDAQPHPSPCLPAGRASLRKGRGLLFPCISIVVSFIVLSVIFFPLVQTRFAATAYHEVASITERVAGYDQAMQLFQNNMIFGVGGGNYTHALMQLIPDRQGWWYQPVHNVGVLFVVEYGLVGVALFLFVIVSFFRQSRLWQVRLWTDSVICGGSRPEAGQTIDNRQLMHLVLLVSIVFPVLLLDHYLWSSYVGLMLLVVFIGILCKQNSKK